MNIEELNKIFKHYPIDSNLNFDNIYVYDNIAYSDHGKSAWYTGGYLILIKDKPYVRTFKNGTIHSFEDRPATYWLDNLTGIIRYKWYLHGEPAREYCKPNIISYYGEGPLKDKPYLIAWTNFSSKDITPSYSEWFKENNIDYNNLTEEDKLLIKMKWNC